MRFLASLVPAAVLAAAPLASAFTITNPTSSQYWVANASNAISWTTSSGDPSVFSVELINPNSTLLQGALAIANNVPASNGTAQSILIVPSGSGFKLQFVNITDINNVFAESDTFEIRPPGTTPAASATPSSAGVSGTASSTSTSTASSSARPNAGERLRINMGALAASGAGLLAGSIGAAVLGM